MAGRPEGRGGRPVGGVPAGSAQALVALVLGVAAGVSGVRRGDVLLAAVFFAIAVAGAAGLLRLLRR